MLPTIFKNTYAAKVTPGNETNIHVTCRAIRQPHFGFSYCTARDYRDTARVTAIQARSHLSRVDNCTTPHDDSDCPPSPSSAALVAAISCYTTTRTYHASQSDPSVATSQSISCCRRVSWSASAAMVSLLAVGLVLS